MKKRDNQDADKGGNKAAAARRAARQAEALRANLRRRKEQSRARQAVAPKNKEDGAGEG